MTHICFPTGNVRLRYAYFKKSGSCKPRVIVPGSVQRIPSTIKDFYDDEGACTVPVLTATMKSEPGYEQPVIVVACRGIDLDSVEPDDSAYIDVREEDVLSLSESMRMAAIFITSCDNDGCDALLYPRKLRLM